MISDVTQELRSVAEQNSAGIVLPKTKGEWESPDCPGNSGFILDDFAVYTFHKKSIGHMVSMTGSEIKKKMRADYGTDRVIYKNNEPDFELFEDSVLGHVTLEEFSWHREGTDGTFQRTMEKLADRNRWTISQVKEYLRDNDLTLHECGDCRTVRVIPTYINSIYKHMGGIGIKLSLKSIGEAVFDGESDYKLSQTSMGGKCDKYDFEKARNVAKKRYNRKKEQIKRGK